LPSSKYSTQYGGFAYSWANSPLCSAVDDPGSRGQQHWPFYACKKCVHFFLTGTVSGDFSPPGFIIAQLPLVISGILESGLIFAEIFEFEIHSAVLAAQSI